MTQICLLDPAKLSQLLQDALPWKECTRSLMVSAANGAILSYAFKGATPGIKDLRTMSTTMTAAYTIASENILVYEAQVTRALSVIIPVGDHILLAVNGPARAPSPDPEAQFTQGAINGEQSHETEVEENQEVVPRENNDQHHLREALEEVAETLAGILREELTGLRWPGDI